jgi:hypothetical protein
MSFSQPFFNTRSSKARTSSFITDNDYKHLHWTEQLKLRPLGTRERKQWPQGDFDIRTDNWDDDNDNFKEK